MGFRNYLGIALVIDVIVIGVAVVTGHDVGPLNELAYVLAGGVAGAAIPKPAG